MATSLLRCERISKGKPVTKTIGLVYQDDGTDLPWLMLDTDGKVDSYHVEEVSCGMDGRSFLLHRSEQSKTADRSDVVDDRYGVFVSRSGQDDLCECKGAQRFGYCKHQTAMRYLVEAGHIDHPLAGAPVEPFPSDEQVADDAILAPF